MVNATRPLPASTRERLRVKLRLKSLRDFSQRDGLERPSGVAPLEWNTEKAEKFAEFMARQRAKNPDVRLLVSRWDGALIDLEGATTVEEMRRVVYPDGTAKAPDPTPPAAGVHPAETLRTPGPGVTY